MTRAPAGRVPKRGRTRIVPLFFCAVVFTLVFTHAHATSRVRSTCPGAHAWSAPCARSAARGAPRCADACDGGAAARSPAAMDANGVKHADDSDDSDGGLDSAYSPRRFNRRASAREVGLAARCPPPFARCPLASNCQGGATTPACRSQLRVAWCARSRPASRRQRTAPAPRVAPYSGEILPRKADGAWRTENGAAACHENVARPGGPCR